MKVVVDQSRCVGAGQCVLVAPEVFDQREDDGIVVLLEEEPPEDLHGRVREAAQLCPALAIELES
ncbi:ferredoxin [Amycolatopsis ultiminotia]|uniref:Ferredoxin n=1 Tax=Amycolatopsis ultiminotia TaxID=543629 RepID=A0ABP6W0V6_9PSEU